MNADRRTAQKGVVGVVYGSRCAPARALFLLRNSRRVPYLRKSTPRRRSQEMSPRPRAIRWATSTGNDVQLFPVLRTSLAQYRRHRLSTWMSTSASPVGYSTGLTSVYRL